MMESLDPLLIFAALLAIISSALLVCFWYDHGNRSGSGFRGLSGVDPLQLSEMGGLTIRRLTARPTMQKATSAAVSGGTRMPVTAANELDKPRAIVPRSRALPDQAEPIGPAQREIFCHFSHILNLCAGSHSWFAATSTGGHVSATARVHQAEGSSVAVRDLFQRWFELAMGSEEVTAVMREEFHCLRVSNSATLRRLLKFFVADRNLRQPCTEILVRRVPPFVRKRMDDEQISLLQRPWCGVRNSRARRPGNEGGTGDALLHDVQRGKEKESTECAQIGELCATGFGDGDVSNGSRDHKESTDTDKSSVLRAFLFHSRNFFRAAWLNLSSLSSALRSSFSNLPVGRGSTHFLYSADENPGQILVFCSVGLYLISGAHAQHHADNGEPVDPEIWEMSNFATVAAKILLASSIGGVGVVVWILCNRRKKITDEDVKDGLNRGPAVPRRTDPIFQLPPTIEGWH